MNLCSQFQFLRPICSSDCREIALAIGLVTALSSIAEAADIEFTGQLDVIQEDNGSAIYSGFTVGTEFVGSIDDSTFDGFITDVAGTEFTEFGCCIAAGGLSVTNDEIIDADTAELLNSLAGTSFTAGDTFDLIDIEGDAATSGGGRIEVGLSFVLDTLAVASDSPDGYPPSPDDVLVTLFFITESDSQGEEIYSALGVLDDPYPMSRFDDVLRDYWAFPFIETLADSGITAGCGGNNYCPEQSVTRAQMAVFLERGINGSDFSPPAATGNVFLDVGASDFAAGFIEQLAADGITSGCGNNNFCPGSNVTRDQMAVFLLRAKYGSSYSPPPANGIFNDVGLNYWAVHWIEQLAAEGITSGRGGDNYCPTVPVTRAQMAVFLVRTFELSPSPSGYSNYELVESVQPVYPARALSRGLEGYVDVSFTVTAAGTVADPVVVLSTSSLFENSAVNAVLQYTYSPRVVGGQATEAQGVMTRVVFEIE